MDDADLLNLQERYETFRQQTLNGHHGKTPQFYLSNVEMVNNYHIFDRSIRTGDLELYKYILPFLTDLFFVLSSKLF